MELNNGHGEKTEGEDRLSLLIDDILLSILGRVNITTAARSGVLSKRWKHLPWLLQELTIDAKDFLPVPLRHPAEAQHIHAAMALLTKAIRSFLATHRCEATISSLRLKLKLYLVDNYADAIGTLLSEAIGVGTVKDLDLSILSEKESENCNDEDMLQQASSVDGFFRTYPGVLDCLTRLSLYVLFTEQDMNHILFDCCKQLQHLYLSNCDTGVAAWKIHAPDSNLIMLELDMCFLVKLEVLHLPKLERLRWDGWMCPNAPLSLGVVPCLKELYLLCRATVYFKGFKLSEVLRDIRVHNLTLSFQGEKLWIQPEGKQLCPAFSNLRKLSLLDIYVEFDLLWTIVLLEAAPSVEIFDVEIWEHQCTMAPEARGRTFGERTKPHWKMSEFTNVKEWLLKEVQITGFSPMNQQMTFIRALMERASNLRTLILKDHAPCEECEQIGALPRSQRLPAAELFPKDKEEQDMVVKQLIGDMADYNVDIIFGI